MAVDHFEKKRWIEKFAEPIYEDNIIRIIVNNDGARMFFIIGGRWKHIIEDERGNLYTILGNVKIKLSNHLSDVIKDALLERILLHE